MKRILNISHSDLDGICAALAVKETHNRPGEHVTTRFVSVYGVNDALLKGLEEREAPYDRIVLSDVCWQPPYRDRDQYIDHNERLLVEYHIPKAVQEFKGELIVLDHHERCLQIKASFGSFLHEESICEVADDRGIRHAGSELAARYFNKNATAPEFKQILMSRLCELTGDYDVWRNPTGYGGALAMGINLMKDPHTALESLSEAFNRLYIWGLANGNRIRDEDLERFIKPTTLGIYAEEAQKMLDQQVREAMESAIWHSTKLCEIYAPLFADLVSHRIYEASGGVVLVRYQKLRENTNRISLRGSEDLPLDFNQILGRFGGGGHRYAAGLQAMKAKGVTIDDIVTSIKGLLSALPSNV